MNGWIDAHHHLWDLQAVDYPWLMAKGAKRFFGDPTPIQRNYLLPEFRAEAGALGFAASVHIQVGARNSLDEAIWVQSVADATPEWPLAQVVFCDLRSADLDAELDAFQALSTVRGVRQIVGRALDEDAATGTNALLDDPRFVEGLRRVGKRGLSFDLQLIPELIEKTARVLAQAPETKVALCHAGSPHDRRASGLAFWEKALRSLSELPSVTCKLSGLGMFQHDWQVSDFRPIVDTVLDQFGPMRVMFGSNFPVDKLYSDYATLVTAYKHLIPRDMHNTVFRDTTQDFYKLDPAL